MLIFEIMLTAGWLLGTILHAVLLQVMLEGRRERSVPRVYPWLVGTVLLWNLGNLVTVFFGQLSTTQALVWLETIGRVIATIGIGLLPSTLVHGAISSKEGAYKRPDILTFLAYLPAAGIVPAVYFQFLMSAEAYFLAVRTSPVLVTLLGLWFVGALAFVGHATYMAGRSPPDSLNARFNRAFGVGLFVIAGLTALVTALELATAGGLPNVGRALLVFIMSISLLPGGLLVYYVYRYRYMDLYIRRSLSFVAVVVAVVLTYSLVIKSLTGQLEARFHVNFALLEGALVAGAVVLFEPARRRLQAAIDAAMAPQRSRRRPLIAEVQALAADAPPGELRPVVSRSQTALTDIFNSQVVVVLKAPPEASPNALPGLVAAPAWTEAEAGPIIAWAESAPAGPVRVDELPEDAARAAQSLSLTDVMAIRTEPAGGAEAAAYGFLGLGKKTGLGQEDVDALNSLTRTLAAVARNAQVVKRLVTLEHKLAEAEKLSSLGRLSATIAHEVKNPLSSIKTIVGVLRESFPEGNSASQDLAVIASEVDRLTKVVTNLLNVARPSRRPGEGTSIVPPPEGFDAREMLEGLLTVLGPDARRRGIRTRTEFAPGTPRVSARENCVRQAAFQLVLNAIEVTPQGGSVALRVGPTDYRDGLGVEIVVEDTGPGIAPEQMEHLFQPFFSMKPGGTGLGLSIAKQEVDSAGGIIEAGNRDGEASGARFRIVLPAAKRAAPT